jgi:hypothetical protein
MQITLNPKTLRKAVQFYVEDQIYAIYTKKELALVNAPVKDALIDELLEDPKFLKGIEKYVSKYVTDYDVLRDAMEDAPCRRLDKILNALDSVEA